MVERWECHGSRGLSPWSEHNAETIAEQISTDSDDAFRRMIIEYDGRKIGESSYRNMTGGVAEIGIKICEAEYRNQEIGRVVLIMLINSLFCDLGYSKIVLDTNFRNRRTRHVYESLGLKKPESGVTALLTSSE